MRFTNLIRFRSDKPGVRHKFIVPILLLALSSCSLIPLNYYRMYSGNPLSRQEVAILTHRNPYSQEVFILNIDGQSRRQPVGILELLPGSHRLLLGYVTSGAVTSAPGRGTTMSFSHYPQQNLLVDAKAGHTYIIFPQADGGSWQPVLHDITDRLTTPEWKRVATTVDKYWSIEHQ